jgi:hypothetical protein
MMQAEMVENGIGLLAQPRQILMTIKVAAGSWV